MSRRISRPKPVPLGPRQSEHALESRSLRTHGHDSTACLSTNAACGPASQRRAFLTDPNHKHVFHFTPKHGSWLNQVELWFSTLARRFLKRGDFASAEEFEERLTGLHGRSQRPSRPSLSLDLHRATVGSGNAIQPNPTAATSRSCMVWHPPPAIRPIPVSTSPLPTAPE